MDTGGMSTTLFPMGYDGPDADTRVDKFVTIEELDAVHGEKMIPEFRRRLFAALKASNGLCGIGGGWRSTARQIEVFLDRHYEVPPGTAGAKFWNGKYWKLKAGYANAAVPGDSFHESQTFASGIVGYQAVDIVGHDSKGDFSHAIANEWMRVNGPRFGLQTAAHWTVKEPWHVQCFELPRSVSEWRSKGRPDPVRWDLPDPDPFPEDDDMQMPKFRIHGYADQFLGVPITAGTNERINATDQAPLVVRSTLTRDQLEAAVGYKLTPMPGEQP